MRQCTKLQKEKAAEKFSPGKGSIFIGIIKIIKHLQPLLLHSFLSGWPCFRCGYTVPRSLPNTFLTLLILKIKRLKQALPGWASVYFLQYAGCNTGFFKFYG
jgi:hypothetical protein